MHRQSLGSPVSKLRDDITLPKSSPSSSSYDDLELKPPKPRRLSSSAPSSSSPDKLIHLIPLLTLLCFLVLYVVSHNPSPADMAQFNGFKRSSVAGDGAESDDVSKIGEVRRGDILAIRSMRSLREIVVADRPKSRPSHRKLADF